MPPHLDENRVLMTTTHGQWKGFWGENIHSFSTILFSDSYTAEPFLRKQKARCPQAVTSGSPKVTPGTHQHHQKKFHL